MKDRICYMILLLMLTISCYKEVQVFSYQPDHDLSLPLLLNIDGQDAVLDDDQKLMKFSFQVEALKDFKPFIMLPAAYEVFFDGKRLKNHQVNDLGSLELNKEYSVTYRASGQTTSFRCRFVSIPLVQITTHDPIKNEPKIISKIRISYPDGERLRDEVWAGVEYRGASTLKYDKKSIDIEVYQDAYSFESKAHGFFEFTKNREWVLDAMYIDHSKVRNKTSFEIWNQIRNTPDNNKLAFAYVEVFVNGKSLGLFCLHQKYNEQSLSLAAEARMYKGIDNSPISKFQEFPEKHPRAAIWNEWEQVIPDPGRSIDWKPFLQLSKLIVEADDETFRKEIGQQLDLDLAIDYYLMVSVMAGFDNFGKNWFFLKRSEQAAFEILAWDMDRTWGIIKEDYGDSIKRLAANGLYNRLIDLNPDQFNQRLRERYWLLRQDVFTIENLRSHFSKNIKEIQRYQIMETENDLWQQHIDLEKEYEHLHDWIGEKIEHLDEYFQQ